MKVNALFNLKATNDYHSPPVAYANDGWILKEEENSILFQFQNAQGKKFKLESKITYNVSIEDGMCCFTDENGHAYLIDFEKNKYVLCASNIDIDKKIFLLDKNTVLLFFSNEELYNDVALMDLTSGEKRIIFHTHHIVSDSIRYKTNFCYLSMDLKNYNVYFNKYQMHKNCKDSIQISDEILNQFDFVSCFSYDFLTNRFATIQKKRTIVILDNTYNILHSMKIKHQIVSIQWICSGKLFVIITDKSIEFRDGTSFEILKIYYFNNAPLCYVGCLYQSNYITIYTTQYTCVLEIEV